MSNDAGPVAWWHDLEGGPIAQQRPPPPNANAPYPNLSTVPPKPKPIDPAMQASTDAALAADRANATYANTQEPLAAAPPKTESGLFAAAKPLPALAPDTAGAALDAKTPDPKTPNAKSPGAPPPRPATPVSAVDTPIPEVNVDQTPAPPIPDAPPEPPRLAGVSIPVTTPHLPPKPPPPPPAVPGRLTADQAAPVSIPFAAGSALLTQNAKGALNALATRRGGRNVEIIGFGEADGLDPQSEVAGVQLGVARAHAIAAYLSGVGVPVADLRLASNAPGRGAAARLLE